MNFKKKLPVLILFILGFAFLLYQAGCKKDDKPIAIVTGQAENIEFRSAILTGNFTGDIVENSIRDFGFEIGQVKNKVAGTNRIVAGNKPQSIDFQKEVQNLDHDTEYFYFAWAKDWDNNLYEGDTLTLKTPFNPYATIPSPETLPVKNITSSSVITTGSVTEDGGSTVTNAGFCIGTEPLPTLENDTFSETQPEEEYFESKFAGLESSTRYFVRAYATNKHGTGYGTQISFDTDPYVPPFSEWVHYDSGENKNSMAVTNGASFDVAIRYIPEQLEPFRNMYISRIKFFPRAPTGTSYTLRIMTGYLPAEEDIVYEQLVQFHLLDRWNDIELDTPFRINDEDELWVGYNVDNQAPGTYPAGTDNGPSYPGYSDLVSIDGLHSWSQLSDLGMYVNWNLQIFITNELGKEIPLCPQPPVKAEFQQSKTKNESSPIRLEKYFKK